MKYELTALVDSKPTTIKSVTSSIKREVETFKGKVVESKDWGKRDLFYKIGKLATSTPLHFVIELEPSRMRDFEEKLRLEDKIVRYLILREN